MDSQSSQSHAHRRHSSIPHGASSQNPPRSSTRLSTFSITPTLAPSIAPSHLSTTPSLTPSEKASPLAQDMHAVHATLARLEEPRLANQRYVVSDDKRAEIGALALGAKLEKALARRMSGQDASFSDTRCSPPKKLQKKPRDESDKAAAGAAAATAAAAKALEASAA